MFCRASSHACTTCSGKTARWSCRSCPSGTKPDRAGTALSIMAPQFKGGTAMASTGRGKDIKSKQAERAHDADDALGRLSNKQYEKELRVLHGELVKLQEWAVQTGAKVCVVFEGRDGAGKGGTIKAITERVSPRVFRVIALPAPTDREKTQMYMQRYLPHLPAAGEVVLFDRSWYNRAGVERVMGFCSEEQVQHFFKAVPLIETAICASGIILLKYWLEVS